MEGGREAELGRQRGTSRISLKSSEDDQGAHIEAIEEGGFPYSKKFRGDRKDTITLFVDGIDDNTSYQQLRRVFAAFGKLAGVYIQRYRKEGRWSRFGFIRFLLKSDAEKAIKMMDGKNLNGKAISVKKAQFPARRGLVNTRTIVKNGLRPKIIEN